jgi:hypothetical protein
MCADTYVELTYGGVTERTAVVRGSLSPQWGHSTSLTFTPGEDVIFSVWEDIKVRIPHKVSPCCVFADP